MPALARRIKLLCGGSMQTGQPVVSAPAADAPGLVICPRCGRPFRSLRAHTSQVPRHLPPPKPAVFYRRGCTVCVTIGRVRDLSPSPATPAPAELPPPEFVTAGAYVLQRTAAEFPDELLYVGTVAPGYDVWLKSLNMLAGPWEWIIQHDGEPLDFSSRRFGTRTDAAEDLVAVLATIVGAPEADSVGVAAPVLAAGAVSPHGSEAADPDVMAMALDLAILTLQKARSRFPVVASVGR